jgi:hypothetical protein
MSQSLKQPTNASSATILATDALVYLSEVSFDRAQSCTLRRAGFSLAQLIGSEMYASSDLLYAGYPLIELQKAMPNDLNAFPVRTLKQAGYSLHDLAAAGHDAASLRAAGFDELQLLSSGEFCAAELRAIGCDLQRFALMQLFEATNGKYWRNRDKGTWGSQRPLSGAVIIR